MQAMLSPSPGERRWPACRRVQRAVRESAGLAGRQPDTRLRLRDMHAVHIISFCSAEFDRLLTFSLL